MSNNKPVSTEAFANFMRKSIENDHIAKMSLLRIMDQMETDQIADSDDITVNREDGASPTLAVTDRAKRALFDEMWVNKGGEIVEAGETYSLNGLTDITFEEAVLIYKESVDTYICTEDYSRPTHRFSARRTFFPIKCGIESNIHILFSTCKNLEVVKIIPYYDDGVHLAEERDAFFSCVKLRIIDTVLCDKSGSGLTWYGTFRACNVLEEVRINKLQRNISINDSPNLSYASVSYMITNAVGASEVTIKFHPNVFAKLMGDETNSAVAALTEEERAQWFALGELAATKQIIIAS